MAQEQTALRNLQIRNSVVGIWEEVTSFVILKLKDGLDPVHGKNKGLGVPLCVLW